MSDGIAAILSQAQAGHMPSFAKLLTYIEQNGAACLQFNELRNPKKPTYRVGITGPPGVGKSSLIGELLKNLRAQHSLKIGVLAVDPTSPISQGAILGDRVRYGEHVLDPHIFIRSLGTRGSLGGLSASAYLMLRAFDACQFDLVLIETVGVGQVEVEIMNVADFVVVVLVPESGDSIQAMKAGIIEIADLFAVNKSDRPGAEALKREIEAAVALSENVKKVEVLMTSALKSEGISPLIENILRAQKSLDLQGNRSLPARIREEAKALLRARIEEEAQKRVEQIRTSDDLHRIMAMI